MTPAATIALCVVLALSVIAAADTIIQWLLTR